MSQPRSTDLDPGLVARVAAGIKYIVSGNKDTAWFGPSNPMTPVAQAANEQAVGRQFDYPVGFNTRTRPRGEEPVSFADMRAVADSYDLLRLVIETRKDQLVNLRWVIKPEDPKAEVDERCKAITKFFRSPDRQHTWSDWIRMILEDLLVIDAPAIYPRRTRGGELYSLEPIDGSTIKRVIDAGGRTPIAPDPAYQQVLKGVPAVDYTVDELIYRPRNLRTHKLYGFSPVEQIITTVNIGLRRQTQQLSYFTAGSIPDGMLAVPEEWSPEQIKQYQIYWDSVMTGNPIEKSKLKMVPGKAAYIATKEAVMKNEFDEWLARVVCYAFSISPQAFVKELNRATASTAKETALQEGLAPIMRWVAELMTSIIHQLFGYEDLEFSWQEEEVVDPLEQAQVLDIYVKAGVMDQNEARAVIGLAAKTPEELAAMKPAPAMGGFGFGASESKDPDAEGSDPKKPGGKAGNDGEEATDEEKLAKALKGGLHIHLPKSPDVVVDIGPTINKFERP